LLIAALSRPGPSRRWQLAILLSGLTGGLISCGKPERIEISESRTPHTSEETPKLDVPYAESLPANDGYRWKLPAGWKEKPATQFRRANFAFGPNDAGECYLSLTQGSDAENINRWRGQMGLPELSEEQVLGLPTKEMFGRPAVFVDLSGTYSGAAGAPPQENTRLLGLVRAENSVTLTIKMTGPADLIAQEAGRFEEFATSLQLTPAFPR